MGLKKFVNLSLYVLFYAFFILSNCNMVFKSVFRLSIKPRFDTYAAITSRNLIAQKTVHLFNIIILVPTF